MSEYTQKALTFLSKHNIKYKIVFIRYDVYFEDDKESRDIFRFTFIRGKKRFSGRFGQSIAESTGTGDKKPSAYSVLACLTKYDPGSFANFCSEFGYSEDSRKAEKIYKGVCKEWKKVDDFFTEEELTELQEIN